MFIDNPRDHSVKHAVDSSSAISVVQIQEVKDELYIDKNELGAELRSKIQYLSTAKLPLNIEFSGSLNTPLTITATVGNDDTASINAGNDDAKVITLQSESVLAVTGKSELDEKTLTKRFKSFDNAEFTLNEFSFDNYPSGLSIPFKELTALKSQLTFLLNNSVDVVANVAVPPLDKTNRASGKPTMSILIADEKDFHLCELTDADVYFKLPESFKKDCPKYINLLNAHPRLIPWFPAVLIGKDYLEAVKILEQVNPKRIVTNNTGIAYKAFEMGIEWVAGPFLNTTNSYALLTLKEELNCAGAFISNEINRLQLRNISRPDDFKLYYSIYHPILMMTSRQCFFQQTVGCKKPSIEDGCMLKCDKATTVTNVKGISFNIDKQKGGYPSIYNDEQFLNLDVIKDLPDLFDEFFIDLTNIGAGPDAEQNKAQLIEHFENILQGNEEASSQLNDMITVSTNAQYRQGL
jgi:putative protease